MTDQANQGIVRGAAIVGSLTAVSRVLGFIRDLLVARLLGTGWIADAFFVAFRIPNLLRSFLAEGALTSAFVPIFSTELRRGKEHAERALAEMSGLLIAVTTILSILGVLYSHEIVALFAPGFKTDPNKFELCAKLLAVMFPYIVFVSLVAMLGGALNTVKVFGSAAMAQVCMNLVLIFGAVVAEFYPNSGADFLSWSVILGGIAGIVVQVPALRRAGFSMRPSFKIVTPVTKELARIITPAIVGAAVYQLVIFLNTLLASLLEEGSISWLFYADRLVQLPIGIFTIALGSVILPALSHAAAGENNELFVKNISDSLRFTLFFILPTSVGLFYMAHPIVELLFQRGAFTSLSTDRTALAIQAYCVGLWAMSCHSMIVRGFLAKKDTLTPTLIGVLTLVCTFVLSLLFMGELRPSQEGMLYLTVLKSQKLLFSLPFLSTENRLFDLGHAGLALASSLSSIIGLIVLSLLLNRRIKFQWRMSIHSLLKSLTASLLMLLPIYFTQQFVTSAKYQVIIGVPLGVIGFCLACFLVRSVEFQETFAVLKRTLNRRACGVRKEKGQS